MKTSFLGVFVLCLILAAVRPSAAQLARFTGDWANVDTHTGNIVRLQISTPGTAVMVHAFGACMPTPCDWGSVTGYAYGPNVGANLVLVANSITAVYTTNFCVETLTIEPKGQELVATCYTHFTDNSHRTDFRFVDTFRRQPLRLSAFRNDRRAYGHVSARVQDIASIMDVAGKHAAHRRA